jgi:hypothetical protein
MSRSSAFAVLRLSQLVLRRRLHRKIGGLLAFEDAVDVAGRAPILVGRPPIAVPEDARQIRRWKQINGMSPRSDGIVRRAA